MWCSSAAVLFTNPSPPTLTLPPLGGGNDREPNRRGEGNDREPNRWGEGNDREPNRWGEGNDREPNRREGGDDREQNCWGEGNDREEALVFYQLGILVLKLLRGFQMPLINVDAIDRADFHTLGG